MFGFCFNGQRVEVKLRRRRQPAHSFSPHVKVNQMSAKLRRIGQRREEFLRGEFFITPLAGVVVEKRSAVHLTRRTVPVQRKGQRQPTGLRTQFLLTHIVRPAAAALSHATTEHQDVNHATVVHIHVIPVVDASPENDHRTAMRFVRSIGKLTGDLFDMTAWHTGNLLAPGRGVGFHFAVILCAMNVIQTTVEAIIRQHQIIDAHYRATATVSEGKMFYRQLADQHRFLFYTAKMWVFVAAKIGECHTGHFIMLTEQRERKFSFSACRQWFQVPFAFLPPAKTDRSIRDNQFASTVKGYRFPLRIVAFAQTIDKI